VAKAKSEEPELEINAKLKNAGDAKEWSKSFKKEKKGKKSSSEGGGSMLYFVGFIGSVVYWMQAADGFGAVVTGILKSLVWPAYVIYKLLESFYGAAN